MSIKQAYFINLCRNPNHNHDKPLRTLILIFRHYQRQQNQGSTFKRLHTVINPQQVFSTEQEAHCVSGFLVLFFF